MITSIHYAFIAISNCLRNFKISEFQADSVFNTVRQFYLRILRVVVLTYIFSTQFVGLYFIKTFGIA
jgi:hypothetical protein